MSTDQFESVGIVGGLTSGGFCTGTLISPRYVLTAGHCAEFLLQVEDESSRTFEVGGNIYFVSQVIIHPDYNPRSLVADIAILELSEDVVDVNPSGIFVDEPAEGEQVILVGFGGTGTGATGADDSFGEKFAGSNTIDTVEEDWIIWTFDTEDESNTGPGDSGGPIFISVNGENLVAGIISAGTVAGGGLGDVAFNTRVDVYADWIGGTILGFGEPPIDDPPSDPLPTDDPIENPAECPAPDEVPANEIVSETPAEAVEVDAPPATAPTASAESPATDTGPAPPAAEVPAGSPSTELPAADTSPPEASSTDAPTSDETIQTPAAGGAPAADCTVPTAPDCVAAGEGDANRDCKSWRRKHGQRGSYRARGRRQSLARQRHGGFQPQRLANQS